MGRPSFTDVLLGVTQGIEGLRQENYVKSQQYAKQRAAEEAARQKAEWQQKKFDANQEYKAERLKQPKRKHEMKLEHAFNEKQGKLLALYDITSQFTDLATDMLEQPYNYIKKGTKFTEENAAVRQLESMAHQMAGLQVSIDGFPKIKFAFEQFEKMLNHFDTATELTAAVQPVFDQIRVMNNSQAQTSGLSPEKTRELQQNIWGKRLDIKPPGMEEEPAPEQPQAFSQQQPETLGAPPPPPTETYGQDQPFAYGYNPEQDAQPSAPQDDEILRDVLKEGPKQQPWWSFKPSIDKEYWDARTSPAGEAVSEESSLGTALAQTPASIAQGVGDVGKLANRLVSSEEQATARNKEIDEGIAPFLSWWGKNLPPPKDPGKLYEIVQSVARMIPSAAFGTGAGSAASKLVSGPALKTILHLAVENGVISAAEAAGHDKSIGGIAKDSAIGAGIGAGLGALTKSIPYATKKAVQRFKKWMFDKHGLNLTEAEVKSAMALKQELETIAGKPLDIPATLLAPNLDAVDRETLRTVVSTKSDNEIYKAFRELEKKVSKDFAKNPESVISGLAEREKAVKDAATSRYDAAFQANPAAGTFTPEEIGSLLKSQYPGKPPLIQRTKDADVISNEMVKRSVKALTSEKNKKVLENLRKTNPNEYAKLLDKNKLPNVMDLDKYRSDLGRLAKAAQNPDSIHHASLPYIQRDLENVTNLIDSKSGLISDARKFYKDEVVPFKNKEFYEAKEAAKKKGTPSLSFFGDKSQGQLKKLFDALTPAQKKAVLAELIAPGKDGVKLTSFRANNVSKIPKHLQDQPLKDFLKKMEHTDAAYKTITDMVSTPATGLRALKIEDAREWVNPTKLPKKILRKVLLGIPEKHIRNPKNLKAYLNAEAREKALRITPPKTNRRVPYTTAAQTVTRDTKPHNPKAKVPTRGPNRSLGATTISEYKSNRNPRGN